MEHVGVLRRQGGGNAAPEFNKGWEDFFRNLRHDVVLNTEPIGEIFEWSAQLRGHAMIKELTLQI